jgi:hypothetical protein
MKKPAKPAPEPKRAVAKKPDQPAPKGMDLWESFMLILRPDRKSWRS